MTRQEQLKLLLESKLVLNEMLDRQAQGDTQFDSQIKFLTKQWGELVRNFVKEVVDK